MIKYIQHSIIFLLIFSVTNSENNQSAKCRYDNKVIIIKYAKYLERKLDTTKANKINNRLAKFNKRIEETSKEISFRLIIYEDKSIFKQDLIMHADNENEIFAKLAGSIGGTKGVFYINKNDSTCINEKNIRDTSYNVRFDLNKWKITKETKLINDFVCFKAISEEIVEGGIAEGKKNVITAWFTAELPSFFGPASYYGLPGTILEVSNGSITLNATNIEFNEDVDKRIEFPKITETITENEFQEKARELAPKRFRKKSRK